MRLQLKPVIKTYIGSHPASPHPTQEEGASVREGWLTACVCLLLPEGGPKSLTNSRGACLIRFL